jgi:putative membrane protein
VNVERLALRWGINALALYLAVGTGWLAGIHAENTTWWAILLLALIFGLVNALVRPILKLLTCPLILLTLGLFTLVINALMLWLTGIIGQQVGLGLRFDDPQWLWILLGSLVVSIVSAVLTSVLREDRRRR